jgi:hypothetical protein
MSFRRSVNTKFSFAWVWELVWDGLPELLVECFAVNADIWWTVEVGGESD